MKNYNPDYWSNKITEVDWSCLYMEANPERAWELILGMYYTHVNEKAPIIEVKNVREAESWADSNLLKLIRTRDKLWQEIKLKQNPKQKNL